MARAQRLLLVAALAVGIVGTAAATEEHGRWSLCAGLRAQVARTRAGSGDKPVQSWDELMESQERLTERGRAYQRLYDAGCLTIADLGLTREDLEG